MKRLIQILLLAAVAVFGVQLAALAADAPAPTDTQRIGALEAYMNNTDPTAPLKDKDGKIPDGLTTAAVGIAGPGHNAFQMVCAALVPVLRRPGAEEEHAVGGGPMLRACGPGHHPLVPVWLQLRLCRR
jgi:hypothetical protein